MPATDTFKQARNAPQTRHLSQDRCKICDSSDLELLAHTAECRRCHALFYYPYPDDAVLQEQGARPDTAERYRRWYTAAVPRNHDNFTAMIRYAIGDLNTMTPLVVLDYGGGGGQFACVIRSLYPNSRVFITDVADAGLLPQWRPFNEQIRFADFESDDTTFDVIFLNDVFEHVNDPVGVLQLLASKLNPGGRVFIDTPRRSWLYPMLRATNPALYQKLLRGTIDIEHLQLWSREALSIAASKANLSVTKYLELTEYTREADYYLDGIKATNPGVRVAGRLFHRFSNQLRAHNKVMAVLMPVGTGKPPEAVSVPTRGSAR